MKLTKGEKAFNAVNACLLAVIAIVTIYPLIYVLSASLSSSTAFMQGKVLLWPVDFTFAAYEKVLSQSNIWIAYANTIYYTVFGTLVSMAITIAGAYPLSKKYLPGGRVISRLVVFTMWFNPGIIPFYLTLKGYGLLDTRTAIILAFAVNTFNVILMRNFFQSVPDALEEAARIDGANDLKILFRIFLPLSLPAIATVALFYAVSRWNGYFWAMVIFQSDSKIPLQVLLKKLIVEATNRAQYDTVDASIQYSSETIIYATIVVSIIPMLIVYPYIQKYFVKGVMVGAVKE